VAITVADLPSEDIEILAPGTSWQVPWELMMLGPFASCALLDGARIRHITIPAMVASAVRRGSGPDAVLTPCDYPTLPVLAAGMQLFDAALSAMESGWDLAAVTDREPRVITARSVYRALVAPVAVHAVPASLLRSCFHTSSASRRARS